MMNSNHKVLKLNSIKTSEASRLGFEAGMQAANGRRTITCNPYDDYTEEYLAWLDSFKKALEVIERTPR